MTRLTLVCLFLTSYSLAAATYAGELVFETEFSSAEGFVTGDADSQLTLQEIPEQFFAGVDFSVDTSEEGRLQAVAGVSQLNQLFLGGSGMLADRSIAELQEGDAVEISLTGLRIDNSSTGRFFSVGVTDNLTQTSTPFGIAEGVLGLFSTAVDSILLAEVRPTDVDIIAGLGVGDDVGLEFGDSFDYRLELVVGEQRAANVFDAAVTHFIDSEPVRQGTSAIISPPAFEPEGVFGVIKSEVPFTLDSFSFRIETAAIPEPSSSFLLALVLGRVAIRRSK